MAVHAAHFTATLQTKPSIFEVVAQQSLDATLHPALQRLALFLATNAPQRFAWLTNNFEEAFVVLKGLLEYHYLEKHSGSFAENFYGLRRLPLDGSDKLDGRQKRLSLFVLVILPYLLRKLDDRIAIYRLQDAEGSLQDRHRLKKLLIALHAATNLLYGVWTLISLLRYMSGRSSSQLPLLSVVGLQLAYSTDVYSSDGFWSAFFKGQLGAAEFLRRAVGGTLEAAAFAVQFLQTWNAERSNYKIAALPVPPPPEYERSAEKYRGKCPICLQQWKIPALLPVSGYVYCFSCLLGYLREERKCPVTKLPAKPMDIIRLYDT